MEPTELTFSPVVPEELDLGASPIVDTSLPWVNPRFYGARGDGVTDDTAAFQAAINAIAALPLTSRPVLLVPGGFYIISAPLTGVPRGLVVEGSGRMTTRLGYTGTGVMFELGTYSTTPPTMYPNTAANVTFRDLQCDVPGTDFSNEGSRHATFVRDNGGGNLLFERVYIAGFAYGFEGAYGSDFTAIRDSRFAYCDVGAYYGPGCQQGSVTGSEFNGCREGLVLERSEQGYIEDCYFIDNAVSDITVEYNAASIRSGISTATTGANINFCGWTASECWHESNNVATRIPPQHILTQGDTNGYPQYFKVERPHLCSGGAASGSNAFWRVSQGTRFELDGLVVYGSQIKYAVDCGTVSPKFVQRNTRQTDGGTNMVLWGGNTNQNAQYEDTLNALGKEGQSATHSVTKSRVIGDALERYHVLADGKQEWGNGTDAVDVNLYRSAVGTLKTDMAFTILGLLFSADDGSTESNIMAQWGSGGSVGKWILQNAGSPTTRRILRGFLGSVEKITLDPAVGMTFADALNIVLGTTTGTKIGTLGGAAGQKIGFWNATPVVQPLLATGASHTVDDVITVLQTIGLVRQS